MGCCSCNCSEKQEGLELKPFLQKKNIDERIVNAITSFSSKDLENFTKKILIKYLQNNDSSLANLDANYHTKTEYLQLHNIINSCNNSYVYEKIYLAIIEQKMSVYIKKHLNTGKELLDEQGIENRSIHTVDIYMKNHKDAEELIKFLDEKNSQDPKELNLNENNNDNDINNSNISTKVQESYEIAVENLNPNINKTKIMFDGIVDFNDIKEAIKITKKELYNYNLSSFINDDEKFLKKITNDIIKVIKYKDEDSQMENTTLINTDNLKYYSVDQLKRANLTLYKSKFREMYDKLSEIIEKTEKPLTKQNFSFLREVEENYCSDLLFKKSENQNSYILQDKYIVINKLEEAEKKVISIPKFRELLQGEIAIKFAEELKNSYFKPNDILLKELYDGYKDYDNDVSYFDGLIRKRIDYIGNQRETIYEIVDNNELSKLTLDQINNMEKYYKDLLKQEKKKYKMPVFHESFLEEYIHDLKIDQDKKNEKKEFIKKYLMKNQQTGFYETIKYNEDDEERYKELRKDINGILELRYEKMQDIVSCINDNFNDNNVNFILGLPYFKQFTFKDQNTNEIRFSNDTLQNLTMEDIKRMNLILTLLLLEKEEKFKTFANVFSELKNLWINLLVLADSKTLKDIEFDVKLLLNDNQKVLPILEKYKEIKKKEEERKEEERKEEEKSSENSNSIIDISRKKKQKNKIITEQPEDNGEKQHFDKICEMAKQTTSFDRTKVEEIIENIRLIKPKKNSDNIIEEEKPVIEDEIIENEIIIKGEIDEQNKPKLKKQKENNNNIHEQSYINIKFQNLTESELKKKCLNVRGKAIQLDAEQENQENKLKPTDKKSEMAPKVINRIEGIEKIKQNRGMIHRPEDEYIKDYISEKAPNTGYKIDSISPEKNNSKRLDSESFFKFVMCDKETNIDIYDAIKDLDILMRDNDGILRTKHFILNNAIDAINSSQLDKIPKIYASLLLIKLEIDKDEENKMKLEYIESLIKDFKKVVRDGYLIHANKETITSHMFRGAHSLLKMLNITPTEEKEEFFRKTIVPYFKAISKDSVSLIKNLGSIQRYYKKHKYNQDGMLSALFQEITNAYLGDMVHGEKKAEDISTVLNLMNEILNETDNKELILNQKEKEEELTKEQSKLKELETINENIEKNKKINQEIQKLAEEQEQLKKELQEIDQGNISEKNNKEIEMQENDKAINELRAQLIKLAETQTEQNIEDEKQKTEKKIGEIKKEILIIQKKYNKILSYVLNFFDKQPKLTLLNNGHKHFIEQLKQGNIKIKDNDGELIAYSIKAIISNKKDSYKFEKNLISNIANDIIFQSIDNEIIKKLEYYVEYLSSCSIDGIKDNTLTEIVNKPIINNAHDLNLRAAIETLREHIHGNMLNKNNSKAIINGYKATALLLIPNKKALLSFLSFLPAFEKFMNKTNGINDTNRNKIAEQFYNLFNQAYEAKEPQQVEKYFNETLPDFIINIIKQMDISKNNEAILDTLFKCLSSFLKNASNDYTKALSKKMTKFINDLDPYKETNMYKLCSLYFNIKNIDSAGKDFNEVKKAIEDKYNQTLEEVKTRLLNILPLDDDAEALKIKNKIFSAYLKNEKPGSENVASIFEQLNSLNAQNIAKKIATEVNEHFAEKDEKGGEKDYFKLAKQEKELFFIPPDPEMMFELHSPHDDYPNYFHNRGFRKLKFNRVGRIKDIKQKLEEINKKVGKNNNKSNNNTIKYSDNKQTIDKMYVEYLYMMAVAEVVNLHRLKVELLNSEEKKKNNKTLDESKDLTIDNIEYSNYLCLKMNNIYKFLELFLDKLLIKDKKIYKTLEKYFADIFDKLQISLYKMPCDIKCIIYNNLDNFTEWSLRSGLLTNDEINIDSCMPSISKEQKEKLTKYLDRCKNERLMGEVMNSNELDIDDISKFPLSEEPIIKVGDVNIEEKFNHKDINKAICEKRRNAIRERENATREENTELSKEVNKNIDSFLKNNNETKMEEQVKKIKNKYQDKLNVSVMYGVIDEKLGTKTLFEMNSRKIEKKEEQNQKGCFFKCNSTQTKKRNMLPEIEYECNSTQTKKENTGATQPNNNNQNNGNRSNYNASSWFICNSTQTKNINLGNTNISTKKEDKKKQPPKNNNNQNNGNRSNNRNTGATQPNNNNQNNGNRSNNRNTGATQPNNNNQNNGNRSNSRGGAQKNENYNKPFTPLKNNSSSLINKVLIGQNGMELEVE